MDRSGEGEEGADRWLCGSPGGRYSGFSDRSVHGSLRDSAVRELADCGVILPGHESSHCLLLGSVTLETSPS